MFDIANTISYGGNMVQGVKENGVSEWFDVSGSAIDKYVAATRAKKEFYIIGSKKLYLGLKSDVINNTFEIISNYNDCC